MDVNNEDDCAAECVDDIKQSVELIQDKSDTKCEQLNMGDVEDVKYVNIGFIKEEHIDLDDKQILADTVKMEVKQDSFTFIKTEEQITAGPSYINTQDYLDIGETVTSQNRATPEVTTTRGFIKEDHIDLDDKQVLANTVKMEVKQDSFTFIKTDEQITPGPSSIYTQDYLDTGETVTSRNRATPEVTTTRGLIKEEHIDLDDAQILADAVKMEVKQDSFTFIKTEEQFNAEPSSISKNEDVPVYAISTGDIKRKYCGSSELEMLEDSRRVIRHRLPTDTSLPFTSSSVPGGAVKMIVDTSYYDNESINQHLKVDIRKPAGKMPYKCESCVYKSANLGNMKKHMRVHTGEKPFICGTCDFRSTQSSNFNKHMRTHTGEKPYKCRMCDYRATNSTSLKRHMRIHTGERPFKCGTCGFRTTQSHCLKMHMRTHTGEKPFKCGTCDYKSTQSSDLNKHMRTHTGEKPFKCKTCDFKSTHSSDFNKHMRTHTGEKPYKCGMCHYKSTNSTALKRHMRIHTGERPFKCETCGFRTTQSHCLKMHMRSHTGEKPFKCETCDYKSIQWSDLNIHMRTHTGEKPYKCEMCHYSSTGSNNLKKHMLTHSLSDR